MRKMLFALAAVCVLSSAATAAPVFFNEIIRDVPGADGGNESIELLGPANFSLNGFTLLAIDGDSTASGVIDQAISLNGLALGSNGLLLIQDTNPLMPSPAAGTTVFNLPGGFTPDLENGSNTFVLVQGFTGAVGDDLDTNNDGTIDVALPFTSVSDAVALLENDGTSNFGFADDLGAGFLTFGGPSAAFTPDAFARASNGGAAAFDITGTSPGPFSTDPSEFLFVGPAGTPDSTFDLTPGSVNAAFGPGVAAVPEPASVALVGVGAAGLVARRLRRRA